MEFGVEVKKFICAESGVDEQDITNETLLFTDGFIDSFTMASLIGFVEETAGISVAPSEVTLENFDTIADIVRYVDEKKSS